MRPVMVGPAPADVVYFTDYDGPADGIEPLIINASGAITREDGVQTETYALVVFLRPDGKFSFGITLRCANVQAGGSKALTAGEVRTLIAYLQRNLPQ